MNQNDKELLLRDLCARLPYNVYIHSDIPNVDYDTYELINPQEDKVFEVTDLDWIIHDCGTIKPYLRPMLSMTKEEEKEFQEIKLSYHFDEDSYILFDWLNKHHFDYRGLIEKGFAIEVTEENNPYKD